MKCNGWDIEVVCANYDEENDCYGDIYEKVEECLKEHPGSKVIYGFYLKKNSVESPDWFSNIEDAVQWANNN